jgi:hypothetical protein
MRTAQDAKYSTLLQPDCALTPLSSSKLHLAATLSARWNVDLLEFGLFDDLQEVHALETRLLEALGWNVSVDKRTFCAYDNAILKPIITACGGGRPPERRRSISMTNDSKGRTSEEAPGP